MNQVVLKMWSLGTVSVMVDLESVNYITISNLLTDPPAVWEFDSYRHAEQWALEDPRRVEIAQLLRDEVKPFLLSHPL